MVFRHISELAGDVMRRVEMKRAVEGSAGDALTPRSTAGKGIGDQPNRGGGTTEPVAFARQGITQTGMKRGGATEFSPTELLPLWKTPQGGSRLGRVRKALSEVATVATAATKGTPRPSAVVISLNAWKAAHRHAANSTGRRAG